MVIIKDMEMPKSCYDCELNNYHFCNITGNLIEKNWDDGTRADDCPLIEILIDAPDKDKRVSVEYKQREIDSINNGYEWNEVEVTNAVIGGAGAILEAHPFKGE